MEDRVKMIAPLVLVVLLAGGVILATSGGTDTDSNQEVQASIDTKPVQVEPNDEVETTIETQAETVQPAVQSSNTSQQTTQSPTESTQQTATTPATTETEASSESESTGGSTTTTRGDTVSDDANVIDVQDIDTDDDEPTLDETPVRGGSTITR